MTKTVILCCILSIVLTACSADIAKRTAYESLRYKAQSDCRSDPGRQCPKDESYDDYQRSLQQQNAPGR